MKHKLYCALLFIALASPACGNRHPISPSTSDLVVLEIITTASGMVYPKEGELLDMRLYESGRFEYDDYPAQNPPQAVANAVPITRKEARLNPEDVRELISLAEQPDFLSAKDKYPGVMPHIDDEWVTTIKFTYQGREKKIVAVNFWDIPWDNNVMASPRITEKLREINYPRSMINLLVKAKRLKAKAIGKP